MQQAVTYGNAAIWLLLERLSGVLAHANYLCSMYKVEMVGVEIIFVKNAYGLIFITNKHKFLIGRQNLISFNCP